MWQLRNLYEWGMTWTLHTHRIASAQFSHFKVSQQTIHISKIKKQTVRRAYQGMLNPSSMANGCCVTTFSKTCKTTKVHYFEKISLLKMWYSKHHYELVFMLFTRFKTPLKSFFTQVHRCLDTLLWKVICVLRLSQITDSRLYHVSSG